MNLTDDRKNILLVATLGLFAAYVVLQLLPLVSENIFFIFGIPLIGLFFLLMIANMRLLLVLLLFSRVLLDPLLAMTKIDILGAHIGIGGGINFLIIMMALYLFAQSPRTIARNELLMPWAVFLLICSLAVIYSPERGKAVKTFLNLVTYLCIFLVPFVVVKNRDDQKFWVRMLLYSSFFPVCFAIFDLATGRTVSEYAGLRVRGTFSHPNILAFYLVLMISVVFYILKNRHFSLTWGKVNALRVYIFGLFVMLLATKTRSAWISCWMLFFVYGLLSEKRYLLYAVLLPPLFLLHSAVLERISDVSVSHTPGVQMSSLSWRVLLWESSLPAIKQKPVFGHGLASFEKMSEAFFKVTAGQVDAHNTYLELLFETGVVGLLSYVSIYLFALRRFYLGMKKRMEGLSLEYVVGFSCVVSYMVVCLADNMLYYLSFNLYFWFFIGILLRGMQFDDEKEDIGNNPVL